METKSENVENMLKEYFNLMSTKNDSKKAKIIGERLSDNIEEVSKQKLFYEIGLENLLSIIDNVDFSEVSSALETIQRIVHETTKTYSTSSILLLVHIHFSDFSLTFEECVSLLSEFSISEICQQLKSQTFSQLVTRDYEYELSKKDEEIAKLHQEISKIRNELNTYKYPPIKSQPNDYEPDAFRAAKEGKLSSIRYLYEIEHIDKNIRNENNNTPLHIACLNNRLPIVEYLLETQHIDKEIKGYCDRTPLHCSCEKGNLPIVEYLIETQHVNIYSRDENNNTPLHIACLNNRLPIVEYLLETQHIDKEIKGYYNKTHTHTSLAHRASPSARET